MTAEADQARLCRIIKVDAGYLSMIADPGVVAQVIEQAAQATS